MTKVDAKKMLESAEHNRQVYRIKKGWRNFILFAVFLMFILIITIPFGIWFLIVALRARVGLTDEGLAISWFTTKGYLWEDIDYFEPTALSFQGGTGGLVGALASSAATSIVTKKTKGVKGPVKFFLKGKRGWKVIQAHAVQSSWEMCEEIEKFHGSQFLPREDEGDQHQQQA